MPSLVEKVTLTSLLRQTSDGRKRKSATTSSGGGSSGGGVGILKMFKILPMLSTGCKVAAMLGKSAGKALLSDSADATITLFGPRRGKASLAIHDDLRSPPAFLIELPMLTAHLHKEMASGLVRIALESETRTHKRKLMEEHVWAVYCNGRKSGYSIRRRELSDDDRHVMQLLRWISVGAGVLPSPPSPPCEAPVVAAGLEAEMTYMRARFERVVGSKDSEALYIINPDDGGGSGGVPDLSIFLVRVKS